jgi:hypothetical protein
VNAPLNVPVDCWKIPEVDGLETIHVFWMDVAPGAGSVTITCYGQAWTAYFNAMGDWGIREFVSSCDINYLTGEMSKSPFLKRSKTNDGYLARIIGAVKASALAAVGL